MEPKMSDYKLHTPEYISIDDNSKFNGVSYKITHAEFIEEDGKHLLRFEYDVNNLKDKDVTEFEDYLGKLIINTLKEAIERDKTLDGNTI